MAFSLVIRSCSGLKSLFPAKAGIVELCASFVAADLNMVDDNWEVWSYKHAKLIITGTNLQSLCRRHGHRAVGVCYFFTSPSLRSLDI